MFLIFVFIFVIFAFFVIYKRSKKYKYDQTKDYRYDLSSNLIATKEIDDSGILDLEDIKKAFDTLIVQIELEQNLLSYLFKPLIEIDGVKHYLEYGAKGIRYLNISSLAGEKVLFTCKNTTLKNTQLKIYGYQNGIDLEKKILILAPHADDAEIAAFGLYKSAKDVTIVTTTIGENGVCNYCEFYNGDRAKAARQKAHLRLLDALYIPSFGGVASENSLALGYFGGSLEFMYTNPEKNSASHVKDFGSPHPYRKVDHAKIDLAFHVEPNFDAFYNDIKSILNQLEPDIIITPHPQIDSNPDHKYTTLTLLKAFKELECEAKILLYTNHLKTSENYPIGKMFGAVDLPPNFSEFDFDGIYSYELDEELQKEKFFALEAIHDLRDSFLPVSLKRAYKHLGRVLKKEVLSKDKSYFRRAVRSNELFFVFEQKKIQNFLEEQ